MPSGLPNKEKQRIRQLYAEGKIGKEDLLKAEAAAYHTSGTCTFYGTANSNQMMMELMGLHIPNAAFINPGTPLRQALTRAAVHRVVELARSGQRPLSEVVDEKAIVNAMIGLLATGGSTNHTIHLPAIARAAGIRIDWQDFEDLSEAVPLIARVYPNGSKDVNDFQDAGGMAFVTYTLMREGLLHGDVLTAGAEGMDAWVGMPELHGDELVWKSTEESADVDMLKPASDPFQSDGGMRLLRGNLGRGGHQDQRGRFRAADHRGAGALLLRPERGARGVQGGRADRRRGRRRPLPGAARQRHARAAQAGADARRSPGPRPEGGAGHRRPHVGRERQGAGSDPCLAGSASRRAAWRGCATATSSASMREAALSRPSASTSRRGRRPTRRRRRSAPGASCSR